MATIQPVSSADATMQMQNALSDSVANECDCDHDHKSVVRGHVQVWLNDELIHDDHNIVPTVGHQLLAHRFSNIGTPGGTVTHIAVGTGTGTPAAADTDLGGIITPRLPVTVAPANWNTPTTQIVYSVNIPGTSHTGMIGEAGLFNALTGGIMFARTVFNPPRDKQAGDTLAITWTITF